MNQQPQQSSGCGKEEAQDLSDIESQRKSEDPLAAPEETDFLDNVNEGSAKPSRKRKLPKTPLAGSGSTCIDGRDDLAARNVLHFEVNIDGDQNTGSCALPMSHSDGSVDTDANKERKEMAVTPSIVGGQSVSEGEAKDRRVKVPDSLTYDGMENDTDFTECSVVQDNRECPVEQTTKSTSPANCDREENNEQLDTIPAGNETISVEGEKMTDEEHVSNVMQSKKKQISCGVDSYQETNATASVYSAEGGKSMAVEALMEEIYENYDSVDLTITNMSAQCASCAEKEQQGNRLSDEAIAKVEFSIGKTRDELKNPDIDASERSTLEECAISAAVDNITTGIRSMSIDVNTELSRKEENNGKIMEYRYSSEGDGHERVLGDHSSAVNPGKITSVNNFSASGAPGVQPANTTTVGNTDGKCLQNNGSKPTKKHDSGKKHKEQEEKEKVNRKDILFETKPPPPKQVEVRVTRFIKEESLIKHLKIIPKVKKKFPEVQLNTSVDQIDFVGNSEDAEAAALYLDNILSSIHISKLQLRKPYIIMLRNHEVQEYINMVLMEKNITCSWKVTDNDEVLVFGFSTILREEFKSVIQSAITFKIIDESRLSFPEAGLLKLSGKCVKWRADSSDARAKLFYTKDIAEDIDKLFKEYSKAKMEPYGISDGKQKESTANDSTEATIGKSTEASGNTDMSNTDLEYAHFALDLGMWECMMKQENVQEWKSKCIISITYDNGDVIFAGKNKNGIEKAVKDFKDMLTSVFIDYVIKSELLSEESEEWKLIEEEALKYNTLISTRTIKHGPLKEKTHFRIGNTDICVAHGCIADLKNTDIIMCSVNKCLHPVTPMSELIFEKGGDLLRSEAIKLAQKHKNTVGTMIFSTVVGELPCSWLAYLVVGETYLEDLELQNKLLSKMTHIFDDTIQKKKSCIAIQLEFSKTLPVRISSSIVAEAIKQSLISKDPAATNICLCVENIENLEPANCIFRKKFEESSEGDFEMVDIFDGAGDEASAAVKVEVVTGSLVNQKVDAIVCVVGESLMLKHGGLSKEIYEKGGSEIQEELSRQTKPGYAEVVHTKGGKLKCHYVLFGILPKMTEHAEAYALKNLKLFLRQCFKAAKKLGCHSIAFPVLGTGRLNYSVLTVAREMYRSAHYYAAASCVDLVNFVLLQDDQGLPEFEALNKRFQDLQRNLGYKEGRSKYFEVKVSGLKTKITVVQKVDDEALASDLIVKNTTLESTCKGGKPYAWQKEKPNPHVLNLEYCKMMFSPSPTDADFREFLKKVLEYIPKKGYEHITLDFSDGLEGYHNYITLTVDVLKTSFALLKSVHHIKIVSSAQMFEELCKLQAAENTANKTFAEKIFACYSVLSGQSVTMSLKEHKKRQSDSWLAVLYSSSRQDLQHIKRKIEQYSKKENGSSVGEGSIFCAKDLPESSKPMKGTRNSQKIDNEKTKLSSPDEDRKAVGRTISEPKQSLSENRFEAGTEHPFEPNDEGDDGSEAFGTVYAELHLKNGSEQQRNLAETLTRSGTGDITVNTDGSKICLTFNFSHRYEIQEQLIQAKTQGLFSISDSTEEERQKRTSDKPSKRVIENVDDKLFELFLLYVKERHKGTQIREDFIERDGNNIHVLGDDDILHVVASKLKALRSWNTETVGFGEDMHQKAMEAELKLKEDHPNVIVKLLENEIRIIGPSEYTGPAKHKANIALGLIKPTGRKRRQFNEEYSSLPVQSLPKQQMENVPSTEIQSSTVMPKLYQTAEGIVVRVYKGDITHLKVECIVNAANENLSHGGGVARAISDAAGSVFQRESDSYVNLHGQIRVTQCVSTPAGALAYEHVLHAVGPRFSSSTDTTSQDELEKTVFNALQLAEELKMKSVALPSISAGIFGGPIDQCADAYAKGVCRFSRRAAKSVIEEIHFVDVQENFVKKIQQTFDIVFTLMQSHFASWISKDLQKCDNKWDPSFNERRLSKHENDFSSLQYPSGGLGTSLMSSEGGNMSLNETHLKSGRSQDGTNFLTRQKSQTAVSSPSTANESFGSKLEKIDQSRRPWPSSGPDLKNYSSSTLKVPHEGNGITSDVSNTNKEHVDFQNSSEFVSVMGIKIVVIKADISKFYVDAVVCPEDINCSGTNSVARAIKSTLGGGDSIWAEAKRRNPKRLSVLRISASPTISCKYVMLVFATRWRQGMDRTEYVQDIRRIVAKVFEETRTINIRSIAFPVIGVGDDSTPFQLCYSILCDEVFRFASEKHKNTHLKDIFIVCLQESAIKICKDFLENKFAVGATERQHDRSNKNINPVPTKKQKCTSCKVMDVDGFDVCNSCSGVRKKRSDMLSGTSSVTANHPYCKIESEILHFNLNGFEEYDTIKVKYTIPVGVQRETDPIPESQYNSSLQIAYLPANDEGRQVLGLFSRAIDQGLVFQVKRNGYVGWSGRVEHKTLLGQGRYGYPDPNYLRNVRQQLAGLGITSDVQPKYDTQM